MRTEDPKDQQIREREERIHELEAKLLVGLGRIAGLERRLGFNSGNSSKSPSSDGLRRMQSLAAGRVERRVVDSQIKKARL